MSAFTLQFSTYTFPNRTFDLQAHRINMDTPAQPIRRANGGVVLDGNILPKKFMINGKLYGNDIDTVHNALNIMVKSVHNGGSAAYLKYRSDRQVLCRLAQEGFDSVPTKKGLQEFSYDVTIGMVTDKPYAESPTQTTTSGSRTNNSATQVLTNAGNYPTRPVFTFVAGSTFLNDIFVQNNGNSHYFRYQGPLLNGQTLVVDCDAGCVLLHVGLTMVDAISYFAGDLFFEIPEGSNTLIIDAATLNYTIKHFDRWYF